MKGMGKKVHRLNAAKFIAMFGERCKVARQSRRVARNVKDHLRAEGGQVGFDALGAGARRVEDDLIIALPLSFQTRQRLGRVGALPSDVLHLITLGVELAARDRRAMAFDRGDFGDTLSQRQGKVAGAAVEFKNAILAVKIAGGEQLFDHLTIAVGIHLSEDIGIDLEREIVLELDRYQCPSVKFPPSARQNDEPTD